MADGRDGKGRFAPGPGNTGRKAGSVSAEKKEFAEACREILWTGIGPHARALFEVDAYGRLDTDAKKMAVRQRFLEWVADRGLGQVQKDVEDAAGAETLEGLLDSIRIERNQESGEAKEAGTAIVRQGEEPDDD